MPDMPMNRTLPSSRSSWSVSTLWFSSSVALLGDMCTWTEIQVVRTESPQRPLDNRADVAGAVVVRVRRGRVPAHLDWAAALGGEEELIAPVPHVAPDELLASAVVGRGVDQADAAVQDRVEQASGVLVRYLGSPRLASPLHGAIPQDCHVRLRPAERPRHDRHTVYAIPAARGAAIPGDRRARQEEGTPLGLRPRAYGSSASASAGACFWLARRHASARLVRLPQPDGQVANGHGEGAARSRVQVMGSVLEIPPVCVAEDRVRPKANAS